MEEYSQPSPFSKRSSWGSVGHVCRCGFLSFRLHFSFGTLQTKVPGLRAQALGAGPVHVREALEARPPLTQVLIVLIGVRAGGVQGAERFRQRAAALEGVRLQGVVGRRAGVHVGFLQPLPNKFPENDVIRDAFKRRPTQERDLRAHIPAGLGVSHDVQVAERGHVEGLRVFLAPALVVVADDVFSDVSLLVENQGLFFPSPHGDDQEDQHYDKGTAKQQIQSMHRLPPPSWGKQDVGFRAFCPFKGNEWAACLRANSQR